LCQRVTLCLGEGVVLKSEKFVVDLLEQGQPVVHITNALLVELEVIDFCRLFADSVRILDNLIQVHLANDLLKQPMHFQVIQISIIVHLLFKLKLAVYELVLSGCHVFRL